ncbi:MAG: hypothetical protein ACI9B9_000487 [Halioglobus sp.]|jgi:hypothetical protein
METVITSTETQSAGSTAADSIDFMPYLKAIIDARWWLLIAMIICAAMTMALAYSQPYMFLSGAKVSIVSIDDPGGVSPDDRRASEVLTLVEHGFVLGSTLDNYNAVMKARLVSRDFTMLFLDQFNVYRHFYPEHWDDENSDWLADFTPDRGESFTRFRDEVRVVEHDEETDILSVSMRWHDPVVARDMANAYVAAFNEFIRERTLNEVARKQEFLHDELRRSEILELQKSIYRLIEAQTAIAMLANARKDYALEIIDPAAMPYKSFSMSRKRKVVLGSVAGLLLSVSALMALTLLRGLIATYNAYQHPLPAMPVANGSPKGANIGEL